MMDLDHIRTVLSQPQRVDSWATLVGRFGDDPATVLGDLVPRAVIDPNDPNEPKPDPFVVARLRNAAHVLLRLSANPDAEVTSAEQEDLVLLSHLAGRPAIAVRNGRYVDPPPQWAFLDRARIDPTLRSVGRIDARGQQIGTGFVVKSGVIMTNRHVAAALLRLTGRTLAVDAVIDFARELDGTSRPARIVEHIWSAVDEAVDLALFRIEGDDLPPPLRIQPAAPPTLEKRIVVAVGYPLTVGPTPIEVLTAVFRDALGIKRVQPGMLRGLAPSEARHVRHDCSTLGGSSGSCLVDYASGDVCGLHFWGRYADHNLAVALWTVVGHERIGPHVTTTSLR